MTTSEKFRATIASLRTADIIDAIARTWDAPEGGEFREWGFDVIFDRIGEDMTDELYSEIWHVCERRPRVLYYSDDPDALVNVARTIDANADAAAFLGMRHDHAGMVEFTDAIEQADDLNGQFAAMELWSVYQRNAWTRRAA